MSLLPQCMDFVHKMWRTSQNPRRDLGSSLPPDAAPPYTDQEQHNLQVLAVTFASISVCSALVAFYWFRRMRRSFRHDLIMLLIQSDMFKALWFMIYPIVVFIHGPVESTSTFCKVDGFFIALGIEASDIAVLMIAVHSALYIFNANARTAVGEGGLYPYRRFAYALWICFPVLMASLAFIHGDQAYVSTGTYCYLPVRPFWYRLALAWIPRYVIFFAIISIYLSIYFFVRYKFKDFGRPSQHEDVSSRDAQQRTKRYSLPATPPLAYHGLLPDSRHSSVNDAERAQAARKLSDTSSGEYRHTTDHRGSLQPLNRPIWTRLQPRSNSDATFHTTLAPTALHPTSIDIPSHPGDSPPLPATPDSRSSVWSRFASRFRRSSPSKSTGTVASMFSFSNFMRAQPQHPDASPYASTPVSQLELVNSRGENIAHGEMQRTREKIRRQLSFMFIYPLVYITMWIVPFVSHALQYDDKYAAQPPYVLSAFVVVIINSQCSVDSWLFSTREKPWRHIPGTNGGFFESLKFWQIGFGSPTSMKARAKEHRGPGKSRAEMAVEARRAYRRRDEEIAAMRGGLEPVRDVERADVHERNWWDNEGIWGRINLPGDGAMSPVAEEVGPFDFPAEHEAIRKPDDVYRTDGRET